MSMFALQQQPAEGFVVKIIQPPSEVEGLADVLLGSLGLTAVLLPLQVQRSIPVRVGAAAWRGQPGRPNYALDQFCCCAMADPAFSDI
jgi:hypothetical protein